VGDIVPDLVARLAALPRTASPTGWAPTEHPCSSGLGSQPRCVPVGILSGAVDEASADWVCDDVAGGGTYVLICTQGVVMEASLPEWRFPPSSAERLA
jgi:hypothetical protein